MPHKPHNERATIDFVGYLKGRLGRTNAPLSPPSGVSAQVTVKRLDDLFKRWPHGHVIDKEIIDGKLVKTARCRAPFMYVSALGMDRDSARSHLSRARRWEDHPHKPAPPPTRTPKPPLATDKEA